MPGERPPFLLKLSGEALGSPGVVHDLAVLDRLAGEIVGGVAAGQPLAIVVGGGNIVRGRSRPTYDPTRGDHMGMLGTLINALAVVDAIEAAGGAARVVAPHAIPQVAESFDRRRVRDLLAAGVVVVFGGGTGHPFFSTDTAAALRAAEIGASTLLKASLVDGVYEADPKRDPNARRFDRLTIAEALARRLAVLDHAAFDLCLRCGIDIRVFDLGQAGAVLAALGDEPPGTLVVARDPDPS